MYSSSALEALQQNYGPGQSQSYSSHERDLNARSAYKDTKKGFNFAKNLDATPGYSPNMQSTSDSPIYENYGRNTPSDSSSNKLFGNLNLKTVEEEDEFLYGDSNSLPEAPKSVKQETVDRDILKFDTTGWSDEELFDEPSSKQESVWKVREGIEAKKLSLSRQGKKSSFEGNIVKKPASERVYTPQHSPSPKLDTNKRINLRLTEYENLAEKQFAFAAEKNSAGNKSKYHAAAEILRKKTLEKSNTRTEALEPFNKSSKPIVFDNTAKSSEKEKRESKADKTSAKTQRQLPKAFSQKDLDNVKNYLKGSQQKRLHPEEYEHESKQPRYETSRHLSPSESKYPKHENARHNSLYDSARHRSPVRDSRHWSPHSRHRSPVKDLRTRLSHSSYDYRAYYSHDVRRRHSRSPGRRSSKSPGRRSSKSPGRRSSKSPGRRSSKSPGRRSSKSPGRRSREKSPGVYRHYRRSPGSYRSREKSRSPSSRDRFYEKSSRRPDRSPEYYPSAKKKREDRDSAESFCSLSLSSESDSSDSSERSSRIDEKKRPYLKTSAANEDKRKKDTTKPEDTVLNSSTKTTDTTTSFLSEDVSKTLADIFNSQTKTTEMDINSELFKPNIEEQDNVHNIFKILEQSQIISEVLGQHQQASSFSLASSSNTNSVATSKILPVSNPHLLTPQLPTMSYPQSYSYPAMAPGTMPYPPPQFFPPSVPTPPACPPPVVPPSVPPMFIHEPTIQAESIAKNRFIANRPPQTLRQISTTPDLESSNPPPQNSKPSVEKSSSEEKGTGFVRKIESPKIKEPEQILKQYKDDIEKYKKMKYDRSITQLQVKHSTSALIKMRSMLNETWGKKERVNHSDRILHTKCKNLVTGCSDSLTRFTEKAKHLDRELKKGVEKLPKIVQQELSKFRSEDYKEKDNCTEKYSCLDPGSHYCNECGANFKNIAGVLEHLQTSQHQKKLEDDDWSKDSKEKQKKDGDDKFTFKYVKGIEFLKPMTGFHCAICKETIDSSLTEQHIKSHEHYVNYKKYVNLHPLYESYVILKKFIQLSVVSRVKKVKEEEEKKKQSESLRKEALAEEKARESSADKGAKEKVKLDDDKETSLCEKTDEKAKSKTTQKYNFIGKAPNFKKTLDPKVVRPKPWYKRESILNKKNDDSNPSESLVVQAKDSKLGEKSIEHQFKKPNPRDSSARHVKEDNPKISLRSTCLSKEESEKNKSGISKSNSEKSVSSAKSVPLPPKESSIPQTDDPIVNRAIKNILGHSSPPCESVSLQEINLPKSTDVETANLNAQLASNYKEDKQPIPMDIDNSQDSKSVSKIVTEEEKDFYILGINKDDLKPLVIPVPPPSYSGNTASYLPSNNSTYDYSFADPTVLNFVRNTPPPNHPHSNANNTQTGTSFSNIRGQMHPYSNQTSMLPMTPYQNASNTPIISYPNTNVPPPMSPYTNPRSAMPYMPQYSNANNMTYSNNMPSMPLHSSPNRFLNQNAPSVPANNFNVNKKQVSEIKPIARTLVTIVPNVEENKSVKSNNLKDIATENKANSSKNLTGTNKGSNAQKEDNNLFKKQDGKNNESEKVSSQDSKELLGNKDRKSAEKEKSIEMKDSKNNTSEEVLSKDSKELPGSKDSCAEKEQSVEMKDSKNNESKEVLSKDSKELPGSKDSCAEKEQSVEMKDSKNSESKEVLSKDSKELPDSKDSCTEKEQSIEMKDSKNNESKEVVSKDSKELPDSKDSCTEKEQSIEMKDSKNNESKEVLSKDSKELPDTKDSCTEKEQSIEMKDSKNNESKEVLSKDSEELLDSKDSCTEKEQSIEMKDSKNNESKEILSKDSKELPNSKDSCTEKEKSIEMKDSKNNESKEVLCKDFKELPDSKDSCTEKESIKTVQKSIEMKESVCSSIQETEISDTFVEMKSSEMSIKDDETMKIDNLECDIICELNAPTKPLDKNQMIDNEPSQKCQEIPEQNQTFDESMDVEDKGTKVDHQSVGNNEKVGVLKEASEKLLDENTNLEQLNVENNEELGVLNETSEELLDGNTLEQQNVGNSEKVGVVKEISKELLDDNINLKQQNIKSKESVSDYNQEIIALDDSKTSDLHKTDNETHKIDNLDSICVSKAPIITVMSTSNELNKKSKEISKEMQNIDESMEISDQDFGFKPEQQSVGNAKKAICDNSQLKEFSVEPNTCDTSNKKMMAEQSPEDSLAQKSDDKTSTVSLTVLQNNEFKEHKEARNTDEKMEIDDENFGFNPEQQDAEIRIKKHDLDQAKHIPEQIEICNSLVTKTSAEQSSEGSSSIKVKSTDIAEVSTSTFKEASGLSEKHQKIEKAPSAAEIEEVSDKNCGFKPGDEKDIEIIEISDENSGFEPDEQNIGNKEKSVCGINQVEDIYKKPEVYNTFDKRTSEKEIEVIDIIDDDSDFEPDEHNIVNKDKAICDLSKMSDISEKPEVCNTFDKGTSDENMEIDKNYDFKTDKIIESDVKIQKIKEEFIESNQMDEITDYNDYNKTKIINIKQEKEEFTIKTNQMDEIADYENKIINIKQEKGISVDPEAPVDQSSVFVSETPIPPTAANADKDNAQCGKSSTDEHTIDNNTTATFADISSSLEKLQKVVTEINAKVELELQEKKEKVNSAAIEKIGSQELERKKVDSESEGKISSLEFNQDSVYEDIENASETFPSCSENREKADYKNEEKNRSVKLNREPGKKCEDSDTDEYEDTEE